MTRRTPARRHCKKYCLAATQPRPALIVCLTATIMIGVSMTAATAETQEADFAGFFDAAVPETLARYHVPGAVVAVVAGDAIVFSKGYGAANIETGAPIDPAATLFRVASLSKVVTATAVMQLVEAGALDLDADVNTYLDGAWLPDYAGAPVTLRQLLTHTAGFDERFLGMAAETPEAQEDLGAYLRRRMPPRVMPPGVAISYSNHGVALAGHLVELVSGQSFVDYVQQHIFDPLGMKHSRFHLPPDALDAMATGYDRKNGTFTPAPYDYPHTVPASSLAATAEDMGRFMIAHLQHDPRLMQPATYTTMHTSPFRHHPEMPGRTLGFGEAAYNGHRVIQHTGLIWGYSSLLMILPDDNVGLFVSVTSDATGAYGRIRSAFLNRFYPDTRAPTAVPAPRAGSAERIQRAAGAYLHNRRPRSTFLKFATVAPVFIDELRVEAGDRAGELVLSWPRTRRAPRRFAEVSPWFFRERGQNAAGDPVLRPDAWELAVMTDAQGNPSHIAMGASAYDRLPWYQTGNVLLGVLAVAASVLMVFLLAWPVAWRRRRSTADPLRALRWSVTLTALLLLGFLAGLGGVAARLNPYAIPHGPPPFLSPLLALPLAAVPLALLATILIFDARRRNRGTPGARAGYACVSLAAVVVLTLLSYWNLLGYHYG